MADDIQEVLYTDSKIDALPDGATSSDVLRVIHGDGSEVAAAVAIHRALEGGGGGGLVEATTFSLTAQEIKDSTLTPHEIVSAPGAGKLLVPLNYSYAYTFVSEAFAGGDLLVGVGTDAGATVTGLLTSSESRAGWTYASQAATRAEIVNQPLQLSAILPGAIAASHVNNSGADYAVGDTGVVSFGGVDATYVVTEVDGGGPGVGAVTGYTITDAGDGYTPGEWETAVGGAQPGIGDGTFKIFVDTVDASDGPGDGTLVGTVYYVVSDV